MMEFAKDIVSTVGGATSHLARRVGGGTVDLAKRVGPKRGLIGLALAGAAVGTAIYLVRYVMGRREEIDALAAPNGADGTNRRLSRAERRAQHGNAQVAH